METNLPVTGNHEGWITTADVAMYLGVEARTIRRYRKQGMPHYGKGTIFFIKHEIDAWITAAKGIQKKIRQQAAIQSAKKRKKKKDKIGIYCQPCIAAKEQQLFTKAILIVNFVLNVFSFFDQHSDILITC